MEYAHKARSDGNEGMARVCARRAAGWAIGAYQQAQMEVANAHHSAYLLLHWFQSQEQFELDDRQAASRLTTQINHAHDLPHPEDPIIDAQQIVDSIKALVQ